MSAVTPLMGRINAYVQEKIKPFKDNEDKVGEELRKLGGPIYEQWAGRIGFKLEDIQAVLSGQGNIRESITMLNNFVPKILEKDIAKDLPAAAMVALFPEVQAVAGDVAAQASEATQRYQAKKQAAQAGVDQVVGPKGEQNDTRTISIQAPVPNTNPVGAEMNAAGLSSSTNVPTTDNRYAGDSPRKDWQDKDTPNRENDNWWLHGMTVDQFVELGGTLSEREKRLFNEGVYRQKLIELKDTIKDEASFKAAVEAAQAEAKKFVPWAAGLMGYDLKWQSQNAVMNAFHTLSVPVGAGVSGTTARTMQTLQALGLGATEGLKVCLGYLLPIQAHSFSEVRQAANAVGAGGYVPKRGSANYNQAPIKSEVESSPGWADFDKKYGPKALGDE